MSAFEFQQKKRFVGYLTGGDGGVQYSIESALALVEGGVDILELGVPFSDPIADGPVIQAAMERALSLGTTPWDVLKIADGIRRHSSVPIVLMSYLNPILAVSQGFLEEAESRGVQALLLVDASNEQVVEIAPHLGHVSMITPVTAQKRLEQIVRTQPRFLYYVIHKGTTGLRKDLPSYAKQQILQIKTNTALPVVAGFGISNKEQAASLLEVADGFVVGSLFVQAMGRHEDPSLLKQLAKHMDPRGESL